MDYKELIIEKPLVVSFWKLPISPDPIFNYFKNKGFEIKEITEKETLIKLSFLQDMLKVVIIAVDNDQMIKELKEFLDFKLPIEVRRKLEVIYVLPEVITLDPLKTFLLSANLIINPKDVTDFDKIYEKAKNYWSNFYKYYFYTKEYFFRKEFE